MSILEFTLYLDTLDLADFLAVTNLIADGFYIVEIK